MAERPLAPFLRLQPALHGAAALALAVAPRAWPVVVGAVLADHLAAVAASLLPRSRLLGPNLRRLPPPCPGRVALTFDDGPDPDLTPRALDLLAAAGHRATFFVVGERAARHPHLLVAAAGQGHRVESHSMTHRHGFWFLPPAALAAEIDRAQDAIAGAVGRRPRLFRAPAGIRPPWLDPFLARRGLGLVSWTRRGFDTVARDPAAVAARLTAGLREGDILVLHDGPGAGVGLATLPLVLARLEAEGLRSVAIGEDRPGAGSFVREAGGADG